MVTFEVQNMSSGPMRSSRKTEDLSRAGGGVLLFISCSRLDACGSLGHGVLLCHHFLFVLLYTTGRSRFAVDDDRNHLLALGLLYIPRHQQLGGDVDSAVDVPSVQLHLVVVGEVTLVGGHANNVVLGGVFTESAFKTDASRDTTYFRHAINALCL